MNFTAIFEVIDVWAQATISTLGYPGLGLVMFLENVLPAISSEAVLLLTRNRAIDCRDALPAASLMVRWHR